MDLAIFNKFFYICNNNCTVHWALCTSHMIGVLNYLIFTVILWNSVTFPHFTYEDHIGDSVPQDVNSGHSDSKSNSAIFLLLPSNYGWRVGLCMWMHRRKDRLGRWGVVPVRAAWGRRDFGAETAKVHFRSWGEDKKTVARRRIIPERIVSWTPTDTQIMDAGAPCIKWPRTMHTVVAPHLQIPNCGSKICFQPQGGCMRHPGIQRADYIFIEKVPQWIRAVQISVVQESTVV